MAGQPSGQIVRGPSLQRSCLDHHQTKSWESIRPWALRCHHSWHQWYDAWRYQEQQNQDHNAAHVRGMEVLESQHTMESTWLTSSHREHYHQVRQIKGWLVDKLSVLQPRVNPTRCHGWQNSVQEEYGLTYKIVPQIRAGASTQLHEGRPIRFTRGSCRHLHDLASLAWKP